MERINKNVIDIVNKTIEEAVAVSFEENKPFKVCAGTKWMFGKMVVKYKGKLRWCVLKKDKYIVKETLSRAEIIRLVGHHDVTFEYDKPVMIPYFSEHFRSIIKSLMSFGANSIDKVWPVSNYVDAKNYEGVVLTRFISSIECYMSYVGEKVRGSIMLNYEDYCDLVKFVSYFNGEELDLVTMLDAKKPVEIILEEEL